MGNCSLKLWRDSTSFPAEMWCLFCCPASWARCLLWVSCVCLTKKFLDFCLCRVAGLILIWGGSVQPLVFLGTQGGWSWEVPIFSVLLGSDWTSLLSGRGRGGVSERKGLYYVERRQNRAPRSFQTLKAFSENGWERGLGNWALLGGLCWTLRDT